jgi:methylenetetrahydrofolate--tRNA-(uracil-5-)-methyltransferase
VSDLCLNVIGGGLAGAEAAWQAAQRGIFVTLFEMRPVHNTPAHMTDRLAELVCSNSLGSNLPDRPLGLLKAELRKLGSLIISVADETALPAGGALAVGREAFAQRVTERIAAHPLIELRRQEVVTLPQEGVTVVATGPLTSERLAAEIGALTGDTFLHFYDAMAPIVALESIDMTRAFRASRYGRTQPILMGPDAREAADGPQPSPDPFGWAGPDAPSEEQPAGGASGDYVNCPMTQDEYDAFVGALLAAERNPLRDFERGDRRFFEACLPVEVIAERGHKALAFGPLRPVGLTDPNTGRRPYAVVQLRQDNLAATLYNMVGFQTNLRWGEQERVFRMIPGLEEAEFVRYGQMHRNTYIHSPSLLEPTMACRGDAIDRAGGHGYGTLFFAGQITGTEGYVGSTTSGYVAGVNAARTLLGQELLVFPPTTMVGALCRYVTSGSGAREDFQPMKANLGLLPPLEQRVRNKRARHQQMSDRALGDLDVYIREWNVEKR